MAQEINKETTEVTQERQVREERSNTGMIIGTIAAVALIAIIIIFFAMSGGSHYDKGNDYLVSKKYSEAVYEFQKVEPSDKDFRKAQSKINYINGLQSYNSGNYPDAAVFLAKVNTDDEYYHEAQLMLEKINGMTLNNSLIDSLRTSRKDTVIVRQEITSKEPSRDPVRRDPPPEDPVKKADLEFTRKYVSQSEGSIGNFESVYQSARNAHATERSDYNKKLSAIQKSFNSIAYQAQNKNSDVLELKNLASQWMNNRISYVQRLITDKSPGESDAARSIREAGDRIYSSLRAQLSKVKKL